MRRRSAIALRFAAAAMAALAMGRVAIADPAEDAKAKAREEFRRGLQLEAAKDYEGALATFQHVAGVKSTPAVRFHIAVCEEHMGDWIAADGAYKVALADAKDQKVQQVEDESTKAIAALEPKIPKLTIKRGDGATSATFTLDGHDLGPASIGVEINVNPGPHHIEAKAAGHEPWSTDVTAVESKSSDVEATMKALPTAAAPLAPSPGESAPLPDEHRGPSALVPLGGTLVALGAASFIVSGVFFGLKEKAISKLDAACGADRQSCPANLLSTKNSGQTDATISTGTFIGGAAGVGLGGILLIVEVATKPKKKKVEAALGGHEAGVPLPSASRGLDLEVVPVPSGVGLGGAF